ncbi:hypothetical protein [Paenibacillus woosongensis]|uniref:hypothetical protein n=1 Tax=Paenibacillus woosongensis TaxID=307580 RepID=UPI0012D97255|nr:hypothetical protein [Paenibacillus woosongensis]
MKFGHQLVINPQKKDKSPRRILRYKGFCPGAPRGTPIMGEEKPDEELMGKRKSSPRLSTTFVMSIFKVCPGSFYLYLGMKKMLRKFCRLLSRKQAGIAAVLLQISICH